MATCYRHPNRETGVSCSSCGRAICPDCMTPTPVGMRCPECAKQRTKVRTAQTIAHAGGGMQVTFVLIAVNVLVFLASQSNQIYDDGALFAPYIAEKHEYWRLVTSGFLHANILHIAFNMYLLWILGQMLEPAIGSARFAGLYVASLLAGSFGAILLSKVDTTTVGASGAVFGLMAFGYLEMRSRGFGQMQAQQLGVLIVVNLALGFVISGVSIGGHIGGLIGGGLVALAYQSAGRLRQPALVWGAIVAVVAISAVGASLVAKKKTDDAVRALGAPSAQVVYRAPTTPS